MGRYRICSKDATATFIFRSGKMWHQFEPLNRVQRLFEQIQYVGAEDHAMVL